MHTRSPIASPSSFVLPAALAAALALTACGEQAVEPVLQPPDAATDISDAVHGPEGNPSFYWLAPMVSQPPAEQLGLFLGGLHPTIKVTCLSADTIECSGEAVVEYSVGAGVVEETDHYHVDVDMEVAGLRPTTEGDTTVYRIFALTDSLAEVGGPFELGHADVVVGSNGKEARNLNTGEAIGLVDGRTLPVKFRIEEGAYEHALGAVEATLDGDPAGPLCQENCSVTVVYPDTATEASMYDPVTGEETTAVLFEAGDVQNTSLVLIDERTTEGDEATCAAGLMVDKKYCNRYLIFPDEPFQNDVRMGICPRELDLSVWELLKADLDGQGEWTLTRPTPVDVSDFLPCRGDLGGLVEAGGLDGLLQYALDFLVAPLHADDETKRWGGLVRDFSDIFWGVEPGPSLTAETVVAGYWHSCAVSGGEAYCWGNNASGQLGNGTGDTAFLPTRVLRPSGVSFAGSIAAYGDVSDGVHDRAHTCVQSSQSGIWCWGDNGFGALGDGTTTNRTEPVLTTTAAEGSVAAGALHTCTTRPALCWGGNGSGQLGDSTDATTRLEPVEVAWAQTDTLTLVHVSAGEQHTCAVLEYSGAVACWGANNYGQLGTGGTGTPRNYPARIDQAGVSYADVDAGEFHTCGVTDSGDLYCWGAAGVGQIGDGSTDIGARTSPTPVSDPASGPVTWAAVAAGGAHTCGLTDAGALYCWGSNNYGQLGTGDQNASAVPVAVSGSMSWREVSAGAAHTCAIATDDAVYCWGRNNSGQLGDGTTESRALPTPVAAPSSP